MSGEAILHIPEGINFDCTGCGNCCFSWPVPLTDDDLKRICSLEIAGEKKEAVHIIETGTEGSVGQRAFTSALGKRSDGKCQFLSPDNRCEIHTRFGEEAKPSMCRLFPYTFTSTPNGVYAAASFASTGLLLNSGRPLSEQKQHLDRTYELFRQLYPDLNPDWTNLQLIDGQPLTFDDYLEIEAQILSAIVRHGNANEVSSQERADKLLVGVARQVLRSVKQKRDFDKIPGLQTKPRTVDSLLINALLSAYFPADVYRENACEIDTALLAGNLVAPPDKVLARFEGKSISYGDLNQYTLGRLDDRSENLLLRFAYLKVFSKLYFGPGFAGLSLIAGLNHLSSILSLVRIVLKLKNLGARKSGSEIAFEEVAEYVRILERRLTVANYSRETRTMLEVLFSSADRAERIATLGS